MKGSFNDTEDVRIHHTQRSQAASKVRRHSREHEREHERDYHAAAPAITVYIKYIALLLFILTMIFTGVRLQIAVPVVLLIYILVGSMAFIMRKTPAFISVFIAAAISIIGIITKTEDIIVCAVAIFFATQLTFKGR